ncbi:DUF4328 domain-containing protein [Pseudonocardia sp. HH130630-07]|uniref:DUF4328 domain-containing protein n=1 Tax=Pseudonocardia sp. HH130630-07 TaxID=1690815 RepID=UPI000814BC7C|nr:DUF4328 domain-containing protein [Pseudonocardia sp. HH130630-07]ANY06694.1 hypothetical protein AFB00_10745 [Pseudonocardia sp. HH130630-07]
MPAPGKAAAPCPRCGRTAPDGSGAFCPWCGRYLAALDWVATVPGGGVAPPATGRARRAGYTGPPRYRSIPSWGLPVGPWRRPPPAAAGAAGRALDRTRWLAGQLIPVLWVTVAMGVVAAAAELWRYGLLVASLSDALSPTAVGWSDAMVWFGGWSSIVALVAGGVLTISWSLAAYRAAAERSGTRAWRSRRSVVAGWLVPGWNLAAPGSLLGEIEHSALELPADRRPRPSRDLLVWWGLWIASVVLGAVTLAWRFRTGTQALADGVLLHVWANLLAAVTAYWTVRVVRRLSGLLEPDPDGPRELLVRAGPGGPATTPGPDRGASPTAAPPVAEGTTAPVR